MRPRNHAFVLTALALALIACGGHPPRRATGTAVTSAGGHAHASQPVAVDAPSSGGSSTGTNATDAPHAQTLDAGVTAGVASNDAHDAGATTTSDAGATPSASDDAHDAGPDAGAALASTPADGGSSSTPSPPEPPPRGQCSRERWGGWTGTPACRAAARRWIRPADLRCRQDSDCVLVSWGCNPHAVNARRARRYRHWAAPCTGPGAGACGSGNEVHCDQGCCVPSGFGLGSLRHP